MSMNSPKDIVRKSAWTMASMFLLVLVAPAWAASSQPTSLDQVIDRIHRAETKFTQNMRNYSPLVESYIQNNKPDAELGTVPSGDTYFLSRLDLSRGLNTVSFIPDRTGWVKHIFGPPTLTGAMKYNATGFAVVSPDEDELDAAHYNFTFVRREFLGEVRCLVFDVMPKPGTGKGRFLGRIWAEDQDYNIVRFQGTFAPRPKFGYYFHFDSWRLNVGPNLWLPAYVYSQEVDMKYATLPHRLSFKAQTRFWGYDVHSRGRQDELTEVLVDSAIPVKDQSDTASDMSPVQATRRWSRQAEDNVLEKLARTGLLAPEGEVDKVLDTVVNNITITNKIDLEPEIHCRVLLTAPLESFTIGHGIVISRGMLDVLPDEVTLAAVLAHEMAHILLAHGTDPMYGFNDKMLFAERQTFANLRLAHTPQQEQAADAKALELLKNSPYRNQLPNAGLFLRALQQRAPGLPNLIRAHLGNGPTMGSNTQMSEMIASAPPLEMNRVDQIAALPMGARIKVDPWSDRAELSKAKPVALLSAREKMFFEVTPVYPFLTRVTDKQVTKKVAASTSVP